ncbi:AMP-binding protein [Cupriavidus numazuensis]|uniref:Medium-chain fatty-acid--CoA ligase n=1 Tax=Cupriavidus numazuensis TaxID=221992 RepID=A0ABN7QCW5_9BURK|nr:AMP-binding protein [Cupriavidus numazuensis]CAG2160366.1 Medium-chain fatty-acid--CoA ligase [Cupriavidus numazuensis]
MKRDIGGWSTRLSDEMIRQYGDSGQWSGVTLGIAARERAAEIPDSIAVIDESGASTFGELYQDGLKLAAALRKRGLVPGDVVSFQLPNWRETMIINLAASLGGYVCNPIVPIYRDAEVRYILKNARSRILFMPPSFRSIDYLEMALRLKPELPDLLEVVLVRGSANGFQNFSEFLDTCDEADRLPEVDANAVKLLLYTSGTTGNPKGVLHSHNTIRAEVEAAIAFWEIRGDDVVLMPSPVTHITGYLYALEMAFAAGVKAVFMERWNAAEAVRLILEQKATVSVGATPFLTELVSEVESQGANLAGFRLYASGGAPVPPEIVYRAARVMPDCVTFRIYGSSEAPTISLGVRATDPLDAAATTDGMVYNNDVRIVDPESGQILPVGYEGEIVARGPEVMLGYTSLDSTVDSFDADGFFRTGDLGHVSESGFLTVTGRKKDLIIRGGENISPKEVEDVLHTHPDIVEAAVVAMPHPRLGETPCAFVVAKIGAAPILTDLIEFLERAGLARQKFPERLFVIDVLPRTASGKVLKTELRERCREASA